MFEGNSFWSLGRFYHPFKKEKEPGIRREENKEGEKRG